jgi:hypothetical protein
LTKTYCFVGGNMAGSQNLLFSGTAAPDDEFDHPPGASIARLLAAGLAEQRWTTGEIDNWRDCGWSIFCARGDVELEVVVTSLGDCHDWFLQIGARRVPGFLGRMCGRVDSANRTDIFDLANGVHKVLVMSRGFSQMKWAAEPTRSE